MQLLWLQKCSATPTQADITTVFLQGGGGNVEGVQDGQQATYKEGGGITDKIRHAMGYGPGDSITTDKVGAASADKKEQHPRSFSIVAVP